MFLNPHNPSSTEVRAWAYSAGATEPCQDWDLVLSWVRHERDYLEFVADINCPNRLYFLHILYLIVGDAVRGNFRSLPEWDVRGLLELSKNFPHREIDVWRNRSIELLKHPEILEYNDWCGGGHARNSAT